MRAGVPGPAYPSPGGGVVCPDMQPSPTLWSLALVKEGLGASPSRGGCCVAEELPSGGLRWPLGTCQKKRIPPQLWFKQQAIVKPGCQLPDYFR